MKKVANVFTAPAKHWVGNGFHVASMFSYHDKDKNLDPFLLMDYTANPNFSKVVVAMILNLLYVVSLNIRTEVLKR